MKLPLVVVSLLFIAVAVAMATRRVRLPYTVALVVAGLVLSLVKSTFYPGGDIGFHLTRELLFDLLLPVLVYEAAFHLETRELFANWKAIGTLAVLGAMVGIGSAGGLIYLSLRLVGVDLPFGLALLVATILAATDPIGVIALLRETHAPRKLAVLMEGESLINDAVAVVAFAVALVALGLETTQPKVTAEWLLGFIGWELLGAFLLGGSIGFFFAWLTSKVDDHLIEVTLSNIAAFASFLVAEHTHASGVIACLIAGMAGGNFGAKYGMSATTRIAVESYWEYIAFVANSIVFLLIGLDVDARTLLGDLPAIIAAWLCLLVARAVFVGIALPPVTKLEGGLPRGSLWVICWGGVRGSIAIVLALGLPAATPQRSLIVNIVFGACLITILLQSLTMGRVLRRFGLVGHSGADADAIAELQGRMRAWEAAWAELELQRRNGAIDEEVYKELKQELADEQRRLADARGELRGGLEALRAVERKLALARLLNARKEALRKAANEGAIDRRVMRQLVGEIDEALHRGVDAHAADEAPAASDDDARAAADDEKTEPEA
ncbi:MAG: cation:proton antiporter [Myxococcales bacterium]|nr:cation:proton antiporter [Myxococcales bacterium]